MANNNFAFPLAIIGTKEQQRALHQPLLEMGYKLGAGERRTNEHTILVTNESEEHGKLGYAVPTSTLMGTRQHVSFDTHSEACILDLARVRKDGRYVLGEPVFEKGSKRITYVSGLNGWEPKEFEHKYRRPTFAEIVNWHKYGSITDPEQPKPEPRPVPSLYKQIMDKKVTKVWSKAWGVSDKINLEHTTFLSKYPINVLFQDGKDATFTVDGILNLDSPNDTYYNITPYTEPAKEPKPEVVPPTERSIEKLCDGLKIWAINVEAEHWQLLAENINLKNQLLVITSSAKYIEGRFEFYKKQFADYQNLLAIDAAEIERHMLILKQSGNGK